MANLRQLRTRVASIKNIERVTHAMQLVAAARMRKAQDSILAARPYAEQLESVLKKLSSRVEKGQHPLLSDRPVKSVALAVVTADRGLCGGFNTNICRLVSGEIQKLSEYRVELVAVGRKGRDYFRNRGHEIASEHTDVFRILQFSRAAQIARELTSRFLAGEVDRVLLAYSEFRSVAQQAPVVRQLLPTVVPDDESAGQSGSYIFEPEPERLLEALVPRHVNFQIWRALLESNAGEQASRMTAMDNASKNAGELIDQLTQEMNKERQSAITLELMDIVGGAEAVAQG
jgi:F-type H+-transporting ATPase subunit gamma